MLLESSMLAIAPILRECFHLQGSQFLRLVEAVIGGQLFYWKSNPGAGSRILKKIPPHIGF
jgi:hypothetical protein